MGKQRFKAVLKPSRQGSGGHLVEVPDEVVSALGGRGRSPVQATFNGVPYRGSIVKMGGGFLLGVTKAVMAAAKGSPGDRLDVIVQLDEAPRDVEIPAEFRKALKENGLLETWKTLAFTHKREYVEAINEARREETRRRRIERAVEMIAERVRSRH